MKITKRDISLLIILAGAVIVFCAYFFVFNGFTEKREAIIAENDSLKVQVEALQTLSGRRDIYMTGSVEAQESIDAGLARFPGEMKEEDMILYAKEIEDNTPTYISSVSLPPFTIVAIEPQREPDQLATVPDIAGVISAYAFRNDGRIPDVYNMALAKSGNSMSLSTTYNGMKSVLRGVSADDDRKNIEQITMSYNNNTGDLTCSMTLNHFVMQGSGKEYTPPTTVTSHGLSCIFGEMDMTYTDEY